jgi:hypothetical protein
VKDENMNPIMIEFGREMVSIQRNPPYREVDLNRLEVNMLRYNQAPGILPVDIDELDLDIRLTYRFGSRKPLSERLKLGSISTQEFFGLLYSLAEIIKNCDNYLLDPAGFVFREDLMFVGSSIRDVALVYIPAKTKEEFSLCSRFKALVVFCIGYITEVQGNHIQECLLYLNENEFSLTGWCQRLREWSRKSVSDEVPATVVSSSFKSEMNRESNVMNRSAKSEDHHAAAFPIVHELWETGPLATEVDEPDESSGEPKRIAAALVILSCALWSLFALQPSWKGAYIASGVQLILADLAFLYWKYGWPERWKAKRLHSKQKETYEQSLADYVISDPYPVAMEGSIPVSLNPEVQAAYSPPMNETVVLRNDPPTELLTQDSIQPDYPCLEGLVGGILRQELIRMTPFVIGRGERCDGIIDEQGISRRQLEIDRTAEGYLVKDLGSSNGTFLNGERMIPYKPYPLSTGDKLRIIGTEWEFRQSSIPIVSSSKVTA